MSGIVGMVSVDGRPADRALLQQMTASLAYRGPDAQQIWSEGPAGFGHALLRSTRESLDERQPASLDQQVWITADARVDGRAELIAKLDSHGRRGLKTPPDGELILHAYHVWGEDCVQHLLGDFAFAIWDGPSKRLFCARDHFGVKPFYYARLSDCLVFSNTLDCVRLHPQVSDCLNELAVGDFLLFDLNQDPTTTTFADIQRLPPAHTLTWSQGDLRVRRYWQLPIEDPLQYKQPSDYIEQFLELLRRAVEDRLRAERVAIFMSGGLDSTTVAATARRLLPKPSAPGELRAYTVVYDRLIPDEERYYTQLAAQTLDIPVEFFVADDYKLYERWDQPELQTPEPVHHPLAAIAADQFRQVAARHRVALTGYGGDPALSTSLSSHALRLAKGLRLGRLARDLAQYLMAEGRMSRLYVRTRLRILFGKNRWRRFYPGWLNEDFARRWDLAARWEQVNNKPMPFHPTRPNAYQSLLHEYWPSLFEGEDPGVILLPLESRHPFFDLRLVQFLLRLPPLPWCSDKELLRAAMRGFLPEAVRLRRKSPMAGDPFVAAMRRGDARWPTAPAPAPELSQFVAWDRVPPVIGKEDAEQLWLSLRPLSLNFWLQADRLARYKLWGARRDETATLATQGNPGAEAPPAGLKPRPVV